jgi:long-chain acyl-CoA synthetase
MEEMMPIKDYLNIHQMLKETVDGYPEQAAYTWFPEAGRTESVTWQQFYGHVKNVSKSLMALDIAPQDKINIISYSCYRWVLSDLGIVSAGACTVGIYQSNLPRDCQYIIDHCDAVLIFAEDETQLNKLREIRDEIPAVRKVILFNGSAKDDDWVMDFETFLELGEKIPDEDFYQRVADTKPHDTAGIVYTSGTTGIPKGAVITHDNITFTAQSVRLSTSVKEGDDVFLFLPLAHVFARTCTYSSLLMGSTTTFARGMDTIVEDIKTARPHWFASVPRIYEKIYSKVISGAEAKGGAALKIFNWALDVGYQISDRKLKKEPIPFVLGLKYKLATKLVFSKVQAALGGRVRWCISGAAPINADIAKFFHAAGILIVEGIGMTENTSFTNLNRYDNYRFGWVGQPGPGIEQKVDENGEVLFRGRNVMKEYYKMPEDTRATITSDGWQFSGDLGEIDEENFLRITGRKKDLIITAGGKNIAPSAMEGDIATSKYINQVCVVGDRRKYLTALITIDPETVSDFASQNGIQFDSVDDLIKEEKVKALIEGEVHRINDDYASFERIKEVTIVQEFTIENGLLTPTLKLKKNIAIDQYESEIDAMYPAG